MILAEVFRARHLLTPASWTWALVSSLCGPADAAGQAAPVQTDSWLDSIGLSTDQFVLIAPGTFQMGATNVGPDGQPVHQVTITRPFLMQRTEVTQAQWTAVMGSNPSEFAQCGHTCPVEQVSWNDVQMFIERLNARTSGGFRLPTEAEWEYAARSGTTGDYGNAGVLDDLGWYHANGGAKTHPVGEKVPNVWGLHDMHGNVWEWVQDRFSSSYYAVSPERDPTGPVSGASRILRGGSWLYFANFARSAYRLIFIPSHRSNDFGFRLARDP
jgi:formylglycine-generating enzyme required for sulfatase activity